MFSAVGGMAALTPENRMVDRGSAEALHAKASQHYLSGEFAEALAAWEALLRLDPADERALEGTRLSRMMVPELESAPAAPVFEIDHETDLQAAAPASAGPARTAVLPDPIRQSEGIDFGDVSAVAPLALGADDAIDAALANLGGSGSLADLLNMEIAASEPAASSEVDDTGIAPFQSSARAQGGAPPAAGELSRRLSELLAQAEAAAAAGNVDEAKALLARVAVLDEDNVAAQALADKLREKENDNLRQIDDWINEGVQLFEQGRLAEARANFGRVLQAMPDHLEVRDYVRRIEEAEKAASAPAPVAPATPHAQPEEDFLASLTASTPEPVLSAVPLAQPARSRPSAPPSAPVPAPVAGPAPAARRRFSPVLAVGVLAVVAAAGWFFFGRGGGESSDIPESALTGENGRGEKVASTTPAPKAAAGSATTLELPSHPPGDPRLRVDQAVARKDWSAAIVAYNEILAAHPEDVAARAGLMEAAQQYREQKALREQLEQTRRAFADNEYEAGLRLLYRMPKEVDATRVEAGKVAGWVNLGIVALKAGEPDKAIAQLGEALSLSPQDADAKRLQAFAQDYTGKAKDQAYYARVEAMEFRPLPD